MLKQELYFITMVLLYWGLIVTSLYVTHVWFAGSEWITLGVILLSVVSVWLLPELLTIWLIVLSTTAIIMIMVFGISYISIPERAFYIFLLPSIGLFTLYLTRLGYRLLAGNERKAAQKKFESCKQSGKSAFPMQIGMVRWAHFEQFREINPRESRRILWVIKHHLEAHPSVCDVFVLSNGTFLMFADGQARPASLTEQLKDSLENIPFHNIDNPNAIQFQIVQEKWEKTALEPMLFTDLVKHLGRKLETEIIIEY